MEVVQHSLPYKQELDGLRGIAILLVVLFHVWPDYFSFGFVGVDIFFVLSGYLITKIVLTKQAKNSFSLYLFYRNRVRRIFPALALVMVSTLAVGYLLLFPDEYEMLGAHTLSSSFFYQNFKLIDESGYWDTSSQLKPLLHFWSLSIEEQFYVFWPLLIVGFSLVRRHLLLVAVVFLGVAFFSVNNLDSFFHSASRFWELAFGASIVWLEKQSRVTYLVGRYSGAVWVVFCLAILLCSKTSEFDLIKVLILVLATSALILSLHERSDNILKFWPLVFLGLISFPLYLWHYPIVSFGHIFGISVEKYGWEMVALAVVLAYLTYQYIEVHARKQQSKLFMVGMAACVLLLGTLGSYIQRSGGLPERSQILEYEAMREQFIKPAPQDDLCRSMIKETTGDVVKVSHCRVSRAEGATKVVALIGDSHAYVLFPGFAEVLNRNGYNLILLSINSCPTLQGGGRGESTKLVEKCEAGIEQTFEVLDRTADLEKVIVVSRGPVYIYDKGFGDVEKGVTNNPVRHKTFYGDTDYDSKGAFYASVNQTVRMMTEKGLQVFLMLENPELGFDPKQCLGRPYDLFASECKVPYADYQNRMADYRAEMIAVAEKYEGANVLDPERLMCDENYCYARNEENLFYADSNHLSVYGSEYLAEKMVEKMMNTSRNK